MRPGIVKELLHYGMLFALRRSKLLDGLVFQGGTALRLIHASQHWSANLDLAGSKDFDDSSLAFMKDALERFVGKRAGIYR